MAYRDHSQGIAFCYEVPWFRCESETKREADYYQWEIQHLNSTQGKLTIMFSHPDDQIKKQR